MDQKQIYVSFLLQLLALRPVVQFPVTTHRRRHAGRLHAEQMEDQIMYRMLSFFGEMYICILLLFFRLVTRI